MIYDKEHTKEISFPLGGIGTGCIGLGGNGSLIDWEIFNRPNKGSWNKYSGFFVRADSDDGSVSKALVGDAKKDFDGEGYGMLTYTFNGLPHFENHEFTGEFPIGKIDFRSADFPGCVSLTAFNPMIPLNSEDSSLPAAFFEMKFENNTDKTVKYTGCFTVSNPFDDGFNKKISDSAVFLSGNPNGDAYGDLTVSSLSDDSFVQEYWYRGHFMDAYVTFWNEFSGDGLTDRHYEGADWAIGSVASCITVEPGKTGVLRFVLTWNVPVYKHYWEPFDNEQTEKPQWKNYYATKFADSSCTAEYCRKNFERLYKDTLKFKEALFSSTLSPEVLDAVSSTMSVLKSPTVLRLEDGSFWGWEGVVNKVGSCEGTCTHVWSYAYALCFLFPDLERSIRNYEYRYSVDDNGHMFFRTLIPFGRKGVRFPRACVDGQMASVIKTYREWKISGDDEWLKSVWDKTVKALEYAWSEKNEDKWDADKDGMIEGRQHNTLDMELYGPNSWLEGMYLAALKAGKEMAAYLGCDDKAAEYSELFENGFFKMKEELFNGKYFVQKIDLKDKSVLEQYKEKSGEEEFFGSGLPARDDYWNEERQEIKYQIKDGCEIDQMLAQWHANICGLGDIYDKAQRQTALQNLFRNNFKHTMRETVNPWRIFSLNDESGAIMCDYPEGTEKPFIPIAYCEETMHGFEYSLAGLLISEGFEKEGLEIVKSVRAHCDGEKRNPWDEMECGHNYARSMASFALLPIYAGLEFDLPQQTVGFNPIKDGDFKVFWSLGTGWGIYSRENEKTTLRLLDGFLNVKAMHLPYCEKVSKVMIDGKNVPFAFSDGTLTFELSKITDSIVIE